MISMHPGEHLAEVLEGRRVTVVALANALDVPVEAIEDLLEERSDLTPDMAWRLARWSGTSAQFWMNLDSHHRLVRTYEANRAAIDAIEPQPSAA